MSDAERLRALRKLCSEWSPSAIPDLRGRAKRERDAFAVYRAAYGNPDSPPRPWPVYAVDHAADFIEAVLDIVMGDSDEYWMCRGVRWESYDEIRDFGRGAP